MEDPMSDDFAFHGLPSGSVRPSWLTAAEDEMPLAAPSDMTGNNWNEFMAWNPSVPQEPDLKLSGPACILRPEMQRPPLFNRRQNSQLSENALDIPTTGDMSVRPLTGPFTFGENLALTPAFDFDAHTLSSPSSGGGTRNGSFYPTPVWQPQQTGANSLFSPPTYSQPSVSAVPGPASNTPSLHHSQSPGSVRNGHASSISAHSTPEPAPDNPKKRKSSTGGSDSPPAGKKEKGQPPKKTAHNMIEKRYRTNLNDKIAALRDSVPSLRVMSRGNGQGEEEDDPEDLEGLTPAHKLNKATVLSKATEYIRHLEKRNKHLQEEVDTLRTRIDSYEKMAVSGPMLLHGSVGTPDGNRFQEDPFAPPHGMSMSGPPQGMIPVPEHIANLRQGLPPQQHFAPAYPPYSGASRSAQSGPPIINGRRNNNGMMSKLMVGSLAGLMVLEGFGQREHSKEQPADRGLFALPINLATFFAPRVSLGATSAHLPLAKLLLVFCAVVYIVAPFLDFKTKPKKKAAHAVILARAPSLASPVEVRHKAWLTAIQTVWVPRHNLLLEIAALSLKTLKLSTRKIIGWDNYALLTGITKEQEAGRVKAWSIALDAQLTGGDAEISKSRLILTLMASGTLPDTPGRLMLKALHIRVLLWELANAGHGLSWMFDTLSAKLSRRYWNMARNEQQIAANLASKPDNEVEPLPGHLAALLEMECDDVLVPCIVHRAYNLAWNRPIAEQTTVDLSMDGVVEDFAIASPLDALAAWYSSYVLKKGLIGYLASRTNKVKESVQADMSLAAQTAPPLSQSYLRARVAQAVVLDNDRDSRLATACAALPSPSTPSKGVALMNIVCDTPVAIDLQKALTLAKCYSLVTSNHTEARRQAVYVINNTHLPEATTTLLSFVAGYKLLNHCIQDPVLQAETSHALERLASSLRMWVGHETGWHSGLSTKVRGRIVSRCLDASKLLVGLAEREDVDPGYCSSSVKGDDP
jgi:hypothetical protein